MMLRGAGPLVVGQAPEEAIADITAYMAREGFVVSQSGPASVTFTRHKKPDRELVLFFVLLGTRASRLVLGLANTNKPPRRCGIYILRFSNGEVYAGQAVDVTRRYAQHRKTYGDIEQMAFKQTPRGKLDEEERSLIWRLERQGWPLRNVTSTDPTRNSAGLTARSRRNASY
jgi:hypothetical protein